jgi:hypothetical protein
LREICPRKKCNPNIGANIGAITGILLNYLALYKNDCNSIQWTSGYTGLVWWNTLGLESLFDQGIISWKHPSSSFNTVKIFIFFYFYRAFFTSKKYVQKPL